MFFQITKRTVPEDGYNGLTWVYRDGTEKNPGDAVCQSYGTFAGEEDARRDIAAVKLKMKASRYAAVSEG